MEQKQLDELDESYFGEEFVDDFEDISVEDAKPKGGLAKKVKLMKTSKEVSKEKPKMEIKELKNEPRIEAKADVKTEHHPETKEEPRAKIVETAPIHDPWADEGSDTSFFKEASTWKAITGIVVVLLIFSIFTQGFQFNEGNSVTGAVISVTDAENKVLSFVNNNLLQPPFVAEVVSSADAGDLYKVTLSVGGQSVDSYLTKDGKYFFPQGFDTAVALAGAGSNAGLKAGSDDQNAPAAGTGSSGDTVGNTAESTVTQPEAVAQPDTTGTRIVPMKAKKWLFLPNRIYVKPGEKVSIALDPQQGFDFTFALAEYGIEEKVSGPLTVQFTADQKGFFPFTCSSCEDWRGMTGYVVVQ